MIGLSDPYIYDTLWVVIFPSVSGSHGIKYIITALTMANAIKGDKPIITRRSIKSDITTDPALPAAKQIPNPRFLTLVGKT